VHVVLEVKRGLEQQWEGAIELAELVEVDQPVIVRLDFFLRGAIAGPHTHAHAHTHTREAGAGAEQARSKSRKKALVSDRPRSAQPQQHHHRQHRSSPSSTFTRNHKPSCLCTSEQEPRSVHRMLASNFGSWLSSISMSRLASSRSMVPGGKGYTRTPGAQPPPPHTSIHAQPER